MVKKLAITAVAVAAILLALSPLASARPAAHHAQHSHNLIGPDRTVDDGVGGDQFGLVNLNDLDVLNGVNLCPDLGANVGGILGVLGSRDGGDKTACAALHDD